jgi:glycosyltransferase involved in cell wall biosynthesis
MPPQDHPQPSVVIGTCTYRRPQGLQRLLRGLASQRFNRVQRPALQILIVDNEGNPETERICAAFREAEAAMPLTYIVEPRRGISQARNTLLDNVPSGCDYLAMIDDDEYPAAEWLDSLLATQQSTGADVVRGPVVAVYNEAAPAWVVNGGYFGWPHDQAAYRDGQMMNSASTGNTLVNMEPIRRWTIRFDTGLALSGGEDTVFFDTLHARGCRIAYSTTAAVEEFIPPERTTLKALLRLSYRNGNNRLGKHLRLSAYSGRPSRVASFIAIQAIKALRDICVGCIRVAGFWLPQRAGPDRFHDGLVQMAKGAGQFAGLFGMRYDYYR